MPDNTIRLSDLYKQNKEASNTLKEESGDVVRYSDLSSITPTKGSSFLSGSQYQSNDLPSIDTNPNADFLQYPNTDTNEIMAQGQSGLGQLAGGLYNTALEVSLGTVRDAGRLLDLQSHIAFLSGTQDDATNWLSKAMEDTMDAIDYDVYRTKWSQGVNPLSTGWWADMMPQLGSTVAMMIPAIGAEKALTKFGALGAKGLGGALYQSGKLIPGVADAAKFAGGYKNLAKGIAGGLTSRAIESLAEGSEAYKSTYDEAFNLTGDEELAKEIAGDAAAGTYKKNWAMAATDIFQYTTLFGSFGNTNKYLKNMLSEGGEEGYQFISQKESAYEAFRNHNLKQDTTFAGRVGDYMVDSEFWNSVIGGAMGGAVFEYVGDKIQNWRKNDGSDEAVHAAAEKVKAQEGAVLANDKKFYYDTKDKDFMDITINGLKDGSLESEISKWEANLQGKPEEFESIQVGHEKIRQKSADRIADIRDAQTLWDGLSANPNISADAKTAAVYSQLDYAFKTRRYNSLTKELNDALNQSIQLNNLTPVAELKRFDILNKSYIGTPLEEKSQKKFDAILAESGHKGSLTTPQDAQLIQMQKDLNIITKEQEAAKIEFDRQLETIEKNPEQANKKADKIKLQKIANKISNPDIPLETLRATRDANKADEGIVEVFNKEIEKREKEAAATAKAEQEAKAKENARLKKTTPKEEIKTETPPTPTPQPQPTPTPEPTPVPETVVETPPVPTPVETKEEVTLEELPEEIIRTDIETSDDNQGPSLDGEADTDEDGYETVDYRSINDPGLIQWDHRDPANNFISEPNGLPIGTEVYLEVNFDESAPEHRVDTKELAPIAIRRKSDRRLIGWLRQEKDGNRVPYREVIYKAYKEKSGIRYEAYIDHVSEGRRMTTKQQNMLKEIVRTGEPVIIALGTGESIEVPNNQEVNTLIVKRHNVSAGHPLLVVRACNGDYMAQNLFLANLTPKAIEHVKSLISGLNQSNWRHTAAAINEVTYLGSRSDEENRRLYMALDEEGLVFADAEGGLHSVSYEEINGTEIGDFAKQQIDRILNDPHKRFNVIKSLINTGTPYTAFDGTSYDSYNDYLSDQRILTGTYAIGSGVYSNPLVYIGSIGLPDEDPIFTNKEPDPDDYFDIKFMKVDKAARFEPSTPESISKEKAWFKKTFPNVPIEVLDSLDNIVGDGGPAAWGAFKNAAVYIVQNAPKGTTYHEAFHTVFDMFLTEKQRDIIYKEAKKEFGDKSNDKLEEDLAEKFRAYMLDRTVPEGFAANIAKFFKNLYHMIMDIILPNRIDINSLFYRTANGVISTNPTRKRIASQFISERAKYLTTPGFTPEVEAEAISIINNMFFKELNLLREQGITENTNSINEKSDDMDVLRWRGARRVPVLNKEGEPVLDKEGNPKERDIIDFNQAINEVYDKVSERLSQLQERIPNFNLIYTNFDENSINFNQNSAIGRKNRQLGFKTLKEKAMRELPDYGLSIEIRSSKGSMTPADVHNNEEDLETEQIVDNALLDETRSKEAWMLEHIGEVNPEDKVSAFVKQLVRSLPRIVDLKLDKEGRIIQDSIVYKYGFFSQESKGRTHGAPMYTDYDVVMKLLRDNLYGAKNATEMVKIMQNIAKTSSYKELYGLAQKIIALPYEQRSKVFTALSVEKLDMVTVVHNTKGDSRTTEVVETNRKTAPRMVIAGWKENFRALALDTKYDVQQAYKDREAVVWGKYTDFLKSAKTLPQVANAMSAYLNKLGIIIPTEAFIAEFTIDTRDGGFDNAKQFALDPKTSSIYRLHDAITKGKNPFEDESKVLNKIASALVKYEPSISPSNVKNVNNKSIYIFANKSFLTKRAAELVKEVGIRDQYIKSSVWADLIARDENIRNNFKVVLLDGVTDKDSNGPNKEYRDFNQGEAEITKLNMFINNGDDYGYYSMLTPADKPLLRFLKFKRFTKKQVKEHLKTHYINAVKDMIKADKDIDRAKAAADLFDKTGDPVDGREAARLEQSLTKNYHYQKKSEKFAKDGNIFFMQWFDGNKRFNELAQEIRKTKNVTVEQQEELMQLIDAYMEKEARARFKRLLDSGKIFKTEEGYESKFVSLKALDKMGLDLVDAVRVHTYNEILGNIEITKLFMGDVAFYKKNPDDNYTTIDAGKRAAQLTAPGEDYNVETSEHQSFTAAVLDTTKIDTPLFKGIDYTDAQGFITLNRFKKVIEGTGRSSKDFERAMEYLERGEDLPRNLQYFLQPIKGHFYGHRKNDVTSVMTPLQIKYSQKVITPRMAKLNPELGKLLTYMNNHGIDELVFDSAVKVGEQQSISMAMIEDDFLPMGAVYTIPNTNWKWQQNVPEHHLDTKILVGTQIRKIILAGLDFEASYDVDGQSMTGREVFDLYQKITSDNIREDLNRLLEEVNNDDKLYDKFVEEIKRKNLGQQYELALKKVNGKLSIPPTMSKDFEFLFTSMFNKVIKQKIRGGQFVQVSAVGNTDLTFSTNEKGIITDAECILPFWSKKFFPHDKNGKILDNKVDKALLKALGYRIPTEAKYSSIALRVKKFLPPEEGSVIVLPPEVIAQMGSDFDIDKLFIMFYNWKKDSETGKYVKDTYTNIEESTRAQRDNKLIDLMRALLMHQNSWNEYTGQNNKDDLIRWADLLQKDKEPLAYTSPSAQEELRENNMEGKDLIGPAANINIHHAVTQLTTMNLGNKALPLLKNTELNGKTIDTPSRRDSLSLNNRTDVSGTPIWKNLAQFLAAFVDNAKEPLAAKLNINKITLPIVTLMLRTRNTMDTSIAFINQPIIRQVCKEWKNAGGTRKSLNKIITNYEKMFKTNKIEPIDSNLNTQLLYSAAKTDNIMTPEQYKVLDVFKTYLDRSTPLSKALRAMRTDSAGIPPNISDAVLSLQNIDDTLEQDVANTEAVFQEYPMLGAFNEVQEHTVDRGNELFLWGRPVIQYMHRSIMDNNPAIDYLSEEDVVNLDLSFLAFIHNDLPFIAGGNKDYVLTKLASVIRDIKAIATTTDKKDLDNWQKSSIFANNFFIRHLNTPGAREGEVLDPIYFNATMEFNRTQEEHLVDAFRELYNSTDEIKLDRDKPYKVSDLAKALIHYSFFTKGFKRGIHNFGKFIPVDVMDDLGFREYYSNIIDEVDVMPVDNFVMRFLSQSVNNKFVPELSGDNFVSGDEQYIIGKETDSMIVRRENKLYKRMATNNDYVLFKRTEEFGDRLSGFEEYTGDTIVKRNKIPEFKHDDDFVIDRFIKATGKKDAVKSTTTFDELPEKSETPTMTYAGIGSRETPPEVLTLMTSIARRLEELGYTLRSGGAVGADTAFERGVVSKKEIFLPTDAVGPREKAIAHEIHPNLKGVMQGSARKSGERGALYVENLMARNTNQVFGKDLDTPVDFVIAYDPSGWEGEGARPKKGGTLQAIDMAARKGIPVINLANKDAMQRLTDLLSKKPTESTDTEMDAWINENGNPFESREWNEDYYKKCIKK